MNHSPLLSQIIKAQDAFEQAVKRYAEIDTSDILLKADVAVKEAIERGHLTTQVSPIFDILVAEKAALQLGELGYVASVFQSGVMPVEGTPGTMKTVLGINLNYKFMPPNTRDAFSL